MKTIREFFAKLFKKATEIERTAYVGGRVEVFEIESGEEEVVEIDSSGRIFRPSARLKTVVLRDPRGEY